MNDAYRPPVTDELGPRPFVDQHARLRVLAAVARVFIWCVFARLGTAALAAWRVIDLSSASSWAFWPALLVDTAFVVGFLAVAIVLLRFLVVAHRNAIRIVGGPLPHGVASIVLWWFVPIANFWMPFRRVREIFAAGSPTGAPDSVRTWKQAWIVGTLLAPPSPFAVEPGASATAVGRALVGCMCFVVAARTLLAVCTELNALQLATWNARQGVDA